MTNDSWTTLTCSTTVPNPATYSRRTLQVLPCEHVTMYPSPHPHRLRFHLSKVFFSTPTTPTLTYGPYPLTYESSRKFQLTIVQVSAIVRQHRALQPLDVPHLQSHGPCPFLCSMNRDLGSLGFHGDPMRHLMTAGSMSDSPLTLIPAYAYVAHQRVCLASRSPGRPLCLLPVLRCLWLPKGVEGSP